MVIDEGDVYKETFMSSVHTSQRLKMCVGLKSNLLLHFHPQGAKSIALDMH